MTLSKPQLLIIVLIIAFVSVVVFLCVQYRRTATLITVGVKLAANATAYEQHPEHSTHRFLIVGDSSAVGVGAENPNVSTAGRLGQDFPGADIENRAVSGAKIEVVIEQLQQSEEGAAYDLILVQAGGNDVVRLAPYRALRTHLIQVIEEARRQGKVVLMMHGGDVGTATLLPSGVRGYYSHRSNRVREIYREIVESYENVYYVDIIAANAEDPFSESPEVFYADDFFHPSGEGYAYWYKQIRAIIDEQTTLKP